LGLDLERLTGDVAGDASRDNIFASADSAYAWYQQNSGVTVEASDAGALAGRISFQIGFVLGAVVV
jgi:hypothetical protein